MPLIDAERLVSAIRDRGARLAIPGIVDLSDLAADATGVSKIVLEAVQGMLLRVALQVAHDDYVDRRERQRQGIELGRLNGKYQGRKPDVAVHARVIALRAAGKSIAETAELAGCSKTQVKRIWAARAENSSKKSWLVGKGRHAARGMLVLGDSHHTLLSDIAADWRRRQAKRQGDELAGREQAAIDLVIGTRAVDRSAGAPQRHHRPI